MVKPAGFTEAVTLDPLRCREKYKYYFTFAKKDYCLAYFLTQEMIEDDMSIDHDIMRDNFLFGFWRKLGAA